MAKATITTTAYLALSNCEQLHTKRFEIGVIVSGSAPSSDDDPDFTIPPYSGWPRGNSVGTVYVKATGRDGGVIGYTVNA